MTPVTLSLLLFGSMLALMAIRVPIAVAMFISGCVGYVLQAGWVPLSFFLNNHAFARYASYDLSVIPLFILMGHFATQGGISKALFQFASYFTSPFRGGLAMASVGASAGFGAICGSSVATAATITSVALPEMKRHGYSARLSTGALAAGGTLGILIPPSVPLLVYAILTEQNIAKLFAAAMVPGLLAMLGYMAAIAIYIRLVPGQAPSTDERVQLDKTTLMGVIPIAAIFGVVFGGIYGGYFTPTEGAAVGAAATLLASIIKRELTFWKFIHCFYATATTSAMIFLIFLGADMMNSALALTQVPGQLAAAIGSWEVAPVAIMIGILMLYVVLGAVMDELSMILLTLPIFFPVIMALDFGMPAESVAIWFGIMVLMVMGFGLLTPPVGLIVYIVNSLAKDVPIVESYRGIVPFLVADIIRAALVLTFPGIALWLVGVLT